MSSLLRDKIRIGALQISPFYLNKARTIEKVVYSLDKHARGKDLDLVSTGEALIPGYPFWLHFAVGGNSFSYAAQRDIFAHYAKEAVNIQGNSLLE